MRGFILHQSNPPCGDVDTSKERIPCTLTSQDDYQQLMAVSSHYPDPPDQMKLGCRDGSNNMTCLPLSVNPVEYICGCSSVKGDLNTAIGWSDEWEDYSQAEEGLPPIMKLSVCDTHAGWCLDGKFMFQEMKKTLVHLVEQYAPLDSQITVSSEWDALHGKQKVRVVDLDIYCGWLRASSDNAPWVKFDLLQSYTAVGVLVRKRCDLIHGEQYVTSFHVSSSDDDVTWSYVGTDIQPVYEGISFTWWFDRDITSRYWKIELLTFVIHPSFQADIIGYEK